MDALKNKQLQSADLPRLHLSRNDFEVMRAHVQSVAPLEACGLLAGSIAGKDFEVSKVIPATNIDRSPVRFRMDPAEQLAAFEWIDANELELVGIYHSHPNGPEFPSATDLSEAWYPQAISLIWTGASGKWRCRAFILHAGRFEPVEIGVSTI